MHTTRWTASIAACLSLLGLVALTGCNDDKNSIDDVEGNPTPMVFAMTNAASGNQIAAFRREDDGTLTFQRFYDTGGTGTGTNEVSDATPDDGIDPLASQGSLAISEENDFLFAVNAGSSTVSSFRIDNDGTLERIDVIGSGGAQPNCLATRGDWLYVGNVGSASNGFDSNITGFRIEQDGALSRINGATYDLSAADAQPASLAFNLTGTQLVVAELTEDTLSTFPVLQNGTLGERVETSTGPGPFGARFLFNGELYVAEARPMEVGALSSYAVTENEVTLRATLDAVDTELSTQMATCWLEFSKDKEFVFTTNTGSDSVSSFAIGDGATLALSEAVASSLEGEGSAPTDMAISLDGEHLYVLNGGLGTITVLTVAPDGTLSNLQEVGGLPELGAQGLVALR